MSYQLTVNEQTFEVSFQHLTKYGSQPRFRKGNFSAITICTVEEVGTKFRRQDVSICSLACAPKPTAAVKAAMNQLKSAIALLDALTPDKPIGCPMETVLENMRFAEWLVKAEQRPDQYSRRMGRLKSLMKVLERSARLREIKVAFLETYLALDKEPVKQPHVELSDAAIEERIAAGHSNLPQEEAVRRYEARIERERIERERIERESKDLATRAGSNS
jgi:hypothetical protein